MSVYSGIGLSFDQRDQLIGLLTELRANGGEFDVARSEELIDTIGRAGADGAGEVA